MSVICSVNYSPSIKFGAEHTANITPSKVMIRVVCSVDSALYSGPHAMAWITGTPARN